ncbi:MAG: PDZ domain-containing protein [Planctomycetaceae bacterium]|nr:PDZ domain-containing protein [Planctomycetaceae bacterium]MBT6155076.1 PDZ domain-containing protein [Planctomycetaceae bacterium]MBT6483408.1 PDZ domain-containing protein [Planctomycetaceae bacterium]MBT6493797.1 PDZ domain-containing protein [Planctomycetaceae bacterium]
MSLRTVCRSLMLLIIAAAALQLQSGKVRSADENPLRATIKDENAKGADLWIYNDIAKARDEARKQNKPLFVTFRCVPCKDCAAFDAEVAKGNEAVHRLAREKFVSVRQVEMKGVDLSLFQFDHDLNWAAMFISADGVVYARYGTQSAAGADAYNSLAGLEKTMHRVLALHAGYPKNKTALGGKRAAQKTYKTALEMPGLEDKDRFHGSTSRKNCIHCHNIHDAENHYAKQSGKFTQDLLWRYPLPENVGLLIDEEDGIRIKSVKAGSPAAKAGIRAGEEVTAMNGQPIASIADIQWVLHHVPNKSATVKVTGSKSGEHTLRLVTGWKKTDISWRGSIWSLSPRLRVWTPELTAGEKKKKGLPTDQSAFLVKWINVGSLAGKEARKSGLREGDVIVAVAGKPLKQMTPPQFNVHLKLNYKVGQKLPLTVLRAGKRRVITIKLVE